MFQLTFDKRLLAIPLLGIFFLQLSCNDSSPTGPSIDKYKKIIELAREKVQETRGLQFIRPVNAGILTREQYSSYNDQWSNSNTSLIMKEFKQIGFIPDTFTNSNYMSENDDSFAAAFYIPGTDSLYIIDSDKNTDDDVFVYTVHEFTHALQEQHFNPFANNVFPAFSQTSQNSDFYISQLCISEGDASVTMKVADFSRFYQTSAAFDSTYSYFKEYRDYYYSELAAQTIPRYLHIQGYAPYIIGPWFILNIYNKDGWPKINTLYHANRVHSTADIINLTNTTPYVFDFSKIIPLLLQNTTKLIIADDDTYGPVMLMALLNELVDSKHCEKAFGWKGDRFAYTLSDDQKFGSFVWAIEFAAEDDAQYITDKLDQFLSSRKLSGVAATRTAATDSITFTSSNTSTLLKRNSTTVLWIENVNEKDSVLSLLSHPILARHSATEKNYSTVSFDDKQKVLDRFFKVHRFR